MSNGPYRKILLGEEQIPTHWYNVLSELPHPLPPPLHPATQQPIGPDDLAPIFPMALIEQEVSTQAEIEIPVEVREKLGLWRPTPLIRARGLEAALKTPAKIFYKNESVSPPGSHKPNTALAQAFYNKQAGVRGLCTETGAGQWGSALSFACAQFGLSCRVFMVKASYNQKPYRRTMMEVWGGSCVPSPSTETEAGRNILAKDPECTGSLGIAISEAVEAAVTTEGMNYALGSVLNHVLLHQTVIGLEAKQQLLAVNEKADVVIGCVGGGSNFAGLALPFARDAIHGDPVRLIAVEPQSCPTLTRGPYAYDYGDTSHLTPLLAMHTLGHGFVPEPIHAGGLRYHGMAPIVSRMVEDEMVRPVSVDQLETFEAGLLFARSEGIIPAPETCHAIAGAVREAKEAGEAGDERTIVFAFSGHGLIDMSAYAAYLSGDLEKHSLDEEILQRAALDLKGLPTP